MMEQDRAVEDLASDLDNGVIDMAEFERLLFQRATVAFSQPNDPELLHGEQIHSVSRNIQCSNNGCTPVTGSLFVTNYKVAFCPDTMKDSADLTALPYSETSAFSLPLCAIYRIEATSLSKPQFSIDLYVRNGLVLRLSGFATKSPRNQRLYTFLMKGVFPISSGSKLFAYFYQPEESSIRRSEEKVIDGWDMYSPEKEFARMGIPEKHPKWRLAYLNNDFAFSPTYPRTFCVPAAVSDDILVEVGKFRCKARIPVLSWIHPDTKCAILRSAQPMVGLNSRCSQDEELLSQARKTVDDKHILFIYDARPWLNAEANRAGGGGYENVGSYDGVELEFAGIANIHTVRNSLTKLQCSCQPSPTVNNFEDYWMTAVEGSDWLKHLRSIFHSALRVISLITIESKSVLIHCSDGWDRTALIASTAMILMDPYFRTLEGFIVLIEKEFVAMGHKFEDRLGYGNSNFEDDERSPVFIQFLDIIWQLTQQFPCSFEFSEDLLLFLAEEVYSCRFGTFLFNSEKDRAEQNVRTQTMSIWTSVLEAERDGTGSYINPFFQPTSLVLTPLISSKTMGVWKQFYLKYNPAYRPPESLASRARAIVKQARSSLPNGHVGGHENGADKKR